MPPPRQQADCLSRFSPVEGSLLLLLLSSLDPAGHNAGDDEAGAVPDAGGGAVRRVGGHAAGKDLQGVHAKGERGREMGGRGKMKTPFFGPFVATVYSIDLQ